MLTIRNIIKNSVINGIGLFTDQDIKKGEIIWVFTPGFDIKYTKNELEQFPDQLRGYLDKYIWLSKSTGLYIFSSDNGKYFNHSSDKNNVLSYYMDGHDEVVTIAIRDICRGEELLDDYGSFEENPDLGFA